jgi:flagellar transcriptional activator FlhC
MARNKSILTEARQIERAVILINLGARLQVLESETDLSYERLLRLYKEVSGRSPSKGQLPFSTDWFMTWQPNIHASLFLNIHEYLNKTSELDEIDTDHQGLPAVPGADPGPGPGAAAQHHPRLAPGEVRRQRHADHDRVASDGHFVHEIARHYVCGLCAPARATAARRRRPRPPAVVA